MKYIIKKKKEKCEHLDIRFASDIINSFNDYYYKYYELYINIVLLV